MSVIPLQVVAQNGVDPTIASLLLSLESVFSVLAGWVILGQKLSGRELFGCALVFAAVLLVQIPTESCFHAENKNIETEPLKGPKFRKPRTETQKRWNFALCSLRRLLSDLRPKLARAACSNKGLRSDAMLAHKANSTVSAYSVRGSKTPRWLRVLIGRGFLPAACVVFISSGIGCSVTILTQLKHVQPEGYFDKTFFLHLFSWVYILF